MTTQQDNAPEGFRTVGTVAGVPPVRWLVHEQCGLPVMGGCTSAHREWCERVTSAGKAHGDRVVQPTIKPRDEPSPPPTRDELWSALDWCLWGQGMGDTFREPLADKMLAALTAEERAQALALIAWWKEHRGGPSWQIAYDELKAERDRALAEVAGHRSIGWAVAFPVTDVYKPTGRIEYDRIGTREWAEGIAENSAYHGGRAVQVFVRDQPTTTTGGEG